MMERTNKIRILICDDHAVVRAGLMAILESASDLEIVGQASDGVEAIEQFDKLRPDILLMDLRMPQLDGLATTNRIRSIHTCARIILLTTYDDEEDIFRALEAGASGYLLKDAAPEQLIDNIRKVFQGRRAISPHIAERLAERMSVRELSDRENEVMKYLAEGKSNKQIAKVLGIADGTVKVHVARILEKLDAQSRSEAVAIALRRGLVRLD